MTANAVKTSAGVALKATRLSNKSLFYLHNVVVRVGSTQSWVCLEFCGGLDHLLQPLFVPPVRPGLRGHSFKVLQDPSRRNSVALLNTSRWMWNRLLTSTVTTTPINSFKHQLDSAWVDLFSEFSNLFTLPTNLWKHSPGEGWTGITYWNRGTPVSTVLRKKYEKLLHCPFSIVRSRRKGIIYVVLCTQLHGNDSGLGSVLMSPVQVSLHLLALQVKPSLPGFRALRCAECTATWII